MTPQQAFEALLWESVPSRPPRLERSCLALGPTEQWRRLQVERDKWRALSEVAADDELEETA